MKVRLMSDLHLDFRYMHYRWLGEDVLVLAGDIGEGISGVTWLEEELQSTIKENRPKHVIYVAGNHEFYGGDIQEVLANLKSACGSAGFYFLENSNLAVDGVNFVGATLWTDYNLYQNEYRAKLVAQSMMNDFRQITFEGRKLSPDDIQQIHQGSVASIIKNCSEGTRRGLRNVVITHHLPTEKATSSKYWGSSLNPAFASDLEWIIQDQDIVYWLCGHSHTRKTEKVYDTTVEVNPRGYPGELTYFVPDLILEV